MSIIVSAPQAGWHVKKLCRYAKAQSTNSRREQNLFRMNTQKNLKYLNITIFQK